MLGLGVYRVLTLSLGICENLLFSGVTFGWASLVFILKQDGYFSHLCSDATSSSTVNSTGAVDGNPGQETVTVFGQTTPASLGVEDMSLRGSGHFASCPEQDAQLQLVFTIATFCYEFLLFPMGLMLDKFGTLFMRTLSSCLLLTSLLLIAVSSRETADIIFPALCLLIVSGVELLFVNMQISNLFGRKKSTVLSLLSGCFDSSAFVFIIFKFGYEAYDISLRTSFFVWAGLCSILCLNTLLLPKRGHIPYPLPPDYRKKVPLSDMEGVNGVYTLKLEQTHGEEERQVTSVTEKNKVKRNKYLAAEENTSSKTEHPEIEDIITSQVPHPATEDATSSQVPHPATEDAISSQEPHPATEDAVSSQVPHPATEDTTSSHVPHPATGDTATSQESRQLVEDATSSQQEPHPAADDTTSSGKPHPSTSEQPHPSMEDTEAPMFQDSSKNGANNGQVASLAMTDASTAHRTQPAAESKLTEKTTTNGDMSQERTSKSPQDGVSCVPEATSAQSATEAVKNLRFPTLRSCFLSLPSLFLLIWFSLLQLNMFFFLGTVNPDLVQLTNNDQALVSQYTTALAFFQGTGLLIAPLCGLLLDRNRTKKRMAGAKRGPFQDLLDSRVVFTLTSFLYVVFNATLMVKVIEVRYASFLLHAFSRSFMYSLVAAGCTLFFPIKYFGSTTGLVESLASLVGLIQRPLFTLLQNYLNNDPFWIYVGLIVLNVITLILPIYIHFYVKSGSKWAVQVQDGAKKELTHSDM